MSFSGPPLHNITCKKYNHKEDLKIPSEPVNVYSAQIKVKEGGI
jgi:hypothetical protein